MNKKELCSEVASRLGIPVSMTRQVISVLFEVIEDTVIGGDEVAIRDFGTFEKSIRRNHWAYDFKSGKSIYVGDKPCVKFFASEKFLTKLEEEKL